jgi:metallophosphoesterase superfamily enzyme
MGEPCVPMFLRFHELVDRSNRVVVPALPAGSTGWAVVHDEFLELSLACTIFLRP